MSPLARRTCVLWVVAGLVFPVGAGADDAAVLYQPADVAQLDLTLTDEAEQALLDDSSSYVAATFGLTVGDLAFGPKQVEVKLKGHGSYRPLGEKAAFKVKFAKTDRLLGLKSLTLNNMVQDPSMLQSFGRKGPAVTLSLPATGLSPPVPGGCGRGGSWCASARRRTRDLRTGSPRRARWSCPLGSAARAPAGGGWPSASRPVPGPSPCAGHSCGLHLLLVGGIHPAEPPRGREEADRAGALRGQPLAAAALGRDEDGDRLARPAHPGWQSFGTR